MPIFVRPRNGGKTFELRVKHPRLPKAVYRTFDDEAHARRAGELALVALEGGEVPVGCRARLQLRPGTSGAPPGVRRSC